jgi:hypothetical protein
MARLSLIAFTVACFVCLALASFGSFLSLSHSSLNTDLPAHTEADFADNQLMVVYSPTPFPSSLQCSLPVG